MRELRRAAHTVYGLHYHFVFTTKYRKPVLVGEIGHSVRDLPPCQYRRDTLSPGN